MATIGYIMLGNAGTNTHIDLGLQVGNLSLEGQEFRVYGSDGNNSFFLRPAGYTFNFLSTATGGADKIYLTGARSEYGVSISDGSATLTRGTGSTGETVIVDAAMSNLSLVFADGFLTADALQQGGGEVLTTSETSANPSLPSDNSGGVRVATFGSVNQNTVFGLDGPVFESYGNGGIDRVFAASGANLDATQLGLGKDEVYLEGSWDDYTKAVSGTQVTLTRSIPNPFDAGQSIDEEIKIVGGIGASNDRILFADGSVDSRDMLLALRGDLNVDLTAEAVWNAGSTSFSSVADIGETGNLALANDTGALSIDGVTSDGTVNVSGVTPGYTWQYSTNGGVDWQTGTGTSFTLDAQASGEVGIQYTVNSIQIRQVSPFGVVSQDVVSNAAAIVVDDTAEAPVFGMDQSGLQLGAAGGGDVSIDAGIFGATGVTLQYWVYLDSASVASSSVQQLADGPAAATLRDGDIYLWDGSDYQNSGVAMAVGWNFISLSRSTNALELVLVNEANASGLTATVASDPLTDGTETFRIGRSNSDAAPLSAIVRDVRLWDGTTDQSAAVADSTTTLTGDENGLLGHWALAAPSGPASNTNPGGDPLVLRGDAEMGGDAAGYPGGNNIYYISDMPLITGTGVADSAIVEVFYDDGGGEVSAGTVAADPSGNWQLQFSDTLVTGEYIFRVQQTDLAGNTASSTALIVVAPDVPDAPDLLAVSDGGSANDDNVTDDTTPDLTGSLPAGTAAPTPVAILRNGTKVAEATDGNAIDGLTVDYGNGSWAYTPPSTLADGVYEFQVSVDGVKSVGLSVTVDTTAPADPVIVNAPALVEAATFTSDTLTIGGTVTDDVAELTVTWDDGDGGTTDATATGVVNTETNTWTASFSLADMDVMADGTALTFTVAAKDLAGNDATPVTSSAIALELDNSAPTTNAAVTIEEQVLLLGATGGTGGTAILDLTDLGGLAAFTDPDAPGSSHATLTYSASNLPSWLEMTSEGVLQIREGETVADLGGSVTITVTAEDGGGLTDTRTFDIRTATPPVLTSVFDGQTEIDVRSAIVLDAASEAVALTTVDDTYQVRLVQQADGAGKLGFDGESADGSQTIEVTVVNGVASFSGGSITIMNGDVVIDFDGDMDLSNNFTIEVDAGLFVGQDSGLANPAVSGNDIAFATVTPDGDGQVAQVWNDTALAPFATWYDGSGGNYVTNETGLTEDLSGVAGVVVVGRDMAADDTIVLETTFRNNLTGFGDDDLLYVDRDFGTTENRIDEDTIAFGNNGGNVPTHLLFATGDGQPQGASLITFVDDQGTPEDESTEFAIAFSNAALGGSSVDESFESITGNAQPVISG